MKKLVLAIFLILSIATLGGCGKEDVKIKSSELEVNTMAVNKDGSIQVGVLEEFKKEYYTKEALESFVQEQLSLYNSSNGKDSITLDSLKIDGGTARMILSYKNMEKYAGFTEVEASFMTVGEAKKAGLLPTTLVESKSGKSVSKDKVMEEEAYHMLVLNEEYDIMVGGKIMYYQNAIVLNNNTIHTGETGTSVIVFK